MNKEAVQIINDKQFWKTKMLQDFNYQYDFKSYYDVKKASKTANDILYINKHEYTREKYPTDGWICIDFNEMNDQIASIQDLLPQ